MRPRLVPAGPIVIVCLVIGIAGCSGGSGPIGLNGSSGSTDEGKKTSGSSSEGSSGTAPSRGTSGSTDTGGMTPSATLPPEPAPSADPSATPPSTPPSGGSSAPRPECVAFANHQCGCYGPNASATCTTDLAKGCEDGVSLCPSQLTWYTCVTGNACGTSACTAPGKNDC
jgi:hypothetical protein